MRTRSQIQATKTAEAKVSFKDRVKVELLLHIRRSQLRCSQTSHWGGVLGMSNQEKTLEGDPVADL